MLPSSEGFPFRWYSFMFDEWKLHDVLEVLSEYVTFLYSRVNPHMWDVDSFLGHITLQMEL